MTTQETISAAYRVVSAYGAGATPACADIWTIQLSVSMCDAADLLLGFEDLARKIINQQKHLCDARLQ